MDSALTLHLCLAGKMGGSNVQRHSFMQYHRTPSMQSKAYS